MSIIPLDLKEQTPTVDRRIHHLPIRIVLPLSAQNPLQSLLTDVILRVIDIWLEILIVTMGQNMVGEAVVIAISGLGQRVFVTQIFVGVQHVFAAG